MTTSALGLPGWLQQCTAAAGAGAEVEADASRSWSKAADLISSQEALHVLQRTHGLRPPTSSSVAGGGDTDWAASLTDQQVMQILWAHVNNQLAVLGLTDEDASARLTLLYQQLVRLVEQESSASQQTTEAKDVDSLIDQAIDVDDTVIDDHEHLDEELQHLVQAHPGAVRLAVQRQLPAWFAAYVGNLQLCQSVDDVFRQDAYFGLLASQS